jgi:hypothetical protein
LKDLEIRVGLQLPVRLFSLCEVVGA